MSKIINVLIALDTDRVKKDFPNTSQPLNPIGSQGSPIPIGHDYGYMIASGTTVNNGQGTGDLNFNATNGDTVRAFAISGSNNFEDEVLLFGMPEFSGPQVLSTFSNQTFNHKPAVVPPLLTPPNVQPETFYFFQANVDDVGTEGYQVQFALYTRDADSDQPELYGYFQWDPTITVPG
jgi:hypothetical protein